MATVKSVHVNIGMSVDKNGVWVKGSNGISVDLNNDDDPKACIQRAFEIAESTLEEKMSDYLNGDDN